MVGRKHLDDRGRPAQAGVRPDEDLRRAGRDEAVDQVLRERPVDLTRNCRRALAPIAPWVVDVDVEPVLV